MISVVVVFSLKTGGSMFVGFDSQNTFTFLTLSQLGSVDTEGFSVWVQRVVVENKFSACYLNDLRRHIPVPC